MQNKKKLFFGNINISCSKFFSYISLLLSLLQFDKTTRETPVGVQLYSPLVTC